MKKKLLVALLTATVVATLVTGCGTPTETSGNVANTTQTEEVVESEVAESVDETVDAIVESVEDTEVVEEPEVEATEELEGTEVQEETEAIEESTEAEVEENVETEAEAPQEIEVETSQETEAEASVVEESTVAEPEVVEKAKVEYTYKDMSATMYAKSAVNVRDLPSTDGNKVGGLSSGQEVKVTGQCNETGWYRLDSGNYVSNNYLVSTKPAPVAPAPSVSTPTEGTAASTATTQDAQLLSGFLGILNAKRAEQGLSQVSADSSLDSAALNGAKALETNYSHGVTGLNVNCNIGKGFSTADAQAVFTAWYNSEGHKAQMMDPYLTTASAAYYNGYVIFIGRINEEQFAEDIAQQIDQQIASGEMEHVSSTDVGGGQTVDVYGTEGAVSVADPDEFASMAEQWGW